MLYTINAKLISSLYIILSVYSALLGFSYSLLIRLEITNIKLFPDILYNSWITNHAILMIFYFVMPFLIGGIGNYYVPIKLGIKDMAYPRLNNIAFWLIPFSLLLFIYSNLNGGTGTGWTFYPPLSTSISNNSLEYMILALHLLGISSILGSINYIITIYHHRIPNLSFKDLNILVWTIFITSILLLVSLPFLATTLTLLLFDRNFNTSFFDASLGGDPLLHQHLFWLFGHPEVYIIILPAFGIISESIIFLYNKPIYGKLSMIYAIIAIALIGCIVWMHHLFATGMDLNSKRYFNIATIIIAIPTSVKIFSWFSSIYGSFYSSSVLALYIKGFIFLFTIGGFTGVVLANAYIDIWLHDTYYVIGHFHYVLSIGAVFAIILSYYLYSIFITGRLFHTTLAKIQFWTLFLGSNITFFPMHLAGMLGMPRRYPHYLSFYQPFNFLSTFGIFINFFSILLLFFIIYLQLVQPVRYFSPSSSSFDPIYLPSFHHFSFPPLLSKSLKVL